MLLANVHRDPIDVRRAMVRRRILAGVLWKFLNEYRPHSGMKKRTVR